MRRFIGLLCLLLAPAAWATTTVTGKIQTLGTGNVTSGAFVRFWLRGCAGNQPRVNGTSVIGPTQGGVFFFDIAADASGNTSGTIYSTRDNAGTGNGDIECGGSKLAVWYGMQIFVAGKGGPETPVHAKSGATLDITQVTPITTNPVIPSPTGDSTYLRLDAGNSPITGNLTAHAIESIRFADQFASVQAAINDLPGSGGVVMIPPGSYAGPTSIPNNNITLRCTAFLACTFTYTANVTFGTSGAFLDRLSLDGIIFDFGNNAAGLILHGTRSGYFAIKIQNSTGAGLTQMATSPNNNSTENDFAFLQMNNVAIGLVLNGDSNLSCGGAQNAAGAIYLNNYEFVDIENVTGSYGIQFTSGADSNTFLQTYILMGAANTTGNAIIFASRCLTSYGDVELQHFVKLTTDAINAGYVGPFIQQNYSGGVIDDFLCGINCTTANSYAFNATATAARGPSWRIGWMGVNPFGLTPQPFIQTAGLINNAGLFQRFLSTATAGANFAANPLHFQSSQWNGATAVISDWSLTPSFAGAGQPTFENFVLSNTNSASSGPLSFIVAKPIQFGVQNASGFNSFLLANAAAPTNTSLTMPAASGTLLGTGSGAGNILQTKRTGGCTTSGGATPFTGPCATTVTWPNTFADGNYTVTCTGNGIGAGVPLLQATTTITGASTIVQTQQATGVNASFTNIECTAIHD